MLSSPKMLMVWRSWQLKKYVSTTTRILELSAELEGFITSMVHLGHGKVELKEFSILIRWFFLCKESCVTSS